MGRLVDPAVSSKFCKVFFSLIFVGGQPDTGQRPTKVRLFPGAEAVLQRLATDSAFAGVQIAVASSTTDAEPLQILGPFLLRGMFRNRREKNRIELGTETKKKSNNFRINLAQFVSKCTSTLHSLRCIFWPVGPVGPVGL